MTFEANLVKNVASSQAESPPPITKTSSSLKKAPSQVAQVEIPRPFCSASPGALSQIDSAPVEIMMALARNSSPSTMTLYGRCDRSTDSTFLS